MDKGFLVYKCRRCGKINKNTHVPHGMVALASIINDVPMPKEWSGTASMLDLCNCEDGGVGVSDLIGFEEDKEN